MSSGYRCLSSGVETNYKKGRGTPATRVRTTLAKPTERSYKSKWAIRKERNRKNGRGKFTPQVNHSKLRKETE